MDDIIENPTEAIQKIEEYIKYHIKGNTFRILIFTDHDFKIIYIVDKSIPVWEIMKYIFYEEGSIDTFLTDNKILRDLDFAWFHNFISNPIYIEKKTYDGLSMLSIYETGE